MADRTSRRRRYLYFDDPGPRYDLDGLPTHQAGARLLATLVYPEREFEAHRAKTYFRLIARYEIEQLEPSWIVAKSLGPSIPLDRRTLEGGAKTFEKRLRRRLDAGNIALDVLAASIEGRRPTHLWGGKWNRSAAIHEAVDQYGVPDRRNFEHRWWDTSCSMIHVAAAWAMMLRRSVNDRTPPETVDRLLTDAAYLRELVKLARVFETAIAGGELAIPASILVKFRLSD